MTYKLPEGWREVKLGDVINFRRGHDLTRKNMDICGEYPVIGSNGLIGKHNEYIIEGPVLTIGRSGNIGKPFYYENSAWPHNTTLYIDDFKSNNSIYIYYLLLTLRLENYKGGSAVPTLNRNHIHPIKIILPPLKEQEAIANTLSILDDKIENNNKIAKNLEAQAQAIFKHWFVDFEFPNEEGKPYKSSGGEMEESELGMIPKGWKVKNIKEVVRINRRGLSPNYTDKSGIPVINQRCVRDFSIKKEEIKYHDNNKKKANSECYLKSYDILINSMGTGTLGRVAQTGKDVEKILVHSCITILRSNENLIDQSILGYWAKYNQALFENMGSGSTGQTSLRKSDINEIQLVVPDINIQNKISILLKRILDYKDILYYQNQKLEELRDTLLPKLISGELRIPLD